MSAYVYKFIKKDNPQWEVVIKKDEYPNIPQWIIDEAEDYGDSYHLPVEHRRHRYGITLTLSIPWEYKGRSGFAGWKVKEGQDVADILKLENEEQYQKLQNFKKMLKEVIKEYPNEIKDWLFYGRFDD